jgi:hypothetical protein
VITTGLCSKDIVPAARSLLERVTGIEPALSAWEAGNAPWPGTPVIGCDQEIQPLQLHLAACSGRKLGRKSPLPGICGDWCSVVPFHALQHPDTRWLVARALGALSLLRVHDRHEE